MRIAIVAMLLALGSVACHKECDEGELRCSGHDLQVCVDPSGGSDPGWRTVVDCEKEGLPLIGNCYDCSDGTHLCSDDPLDPCSGHGGT
ncbi:hypothetical protein [Anaeromyxobacter sp. PSR-1]|uniref:hypothetical protein n=1 Tax=unclassified Anaeromyxobacter TaxID=2620896 RepID=UPI0005DD7B82|nr:hypothetical protein [Anaeromyxobacter sp. PSR-1]GAO01693.1 hypothetical protein PSR1_00551 [Anaeromyxobacter sp. PSR-1]